MGANDIANEFARIRPYDWRGDGALPAMGAMGANDIRWISDGGDAGDGGDGGDGGEFIRLNLPGMKKMSPPTVGANDRRIDSPLFAHRSCTTDRRRPRCGTKRRHHPGFAGCGRIHIGLICF